METVGSPPPSTGDDSEALCRICRSGPEDDSPLFHPCKCSGSIRYCHQDCLVEWLRHSKKKYCELCQHPFTFHKRYRRDMPNQLPPYFYLRRLLLSTLAAVAFAVRAVVVCATWLFLLPLGNQLIFRFYLWSGDFIVWTVLGGEPPMGIHQLPPSRVGRSVATPISNSTAASSVAVNATLAMADVAINRSANATNESGPTVIGGSTGIIGLDLWRFLRALDRRTLKSLGQSLAHDCFEGQVLTCVLVVVFVAIFLLREWILQNMPQPIHELEEPAAAPAAAAAAPAAPHQPPPIAPFPGGDEGAAVPPERAVLDLEEAQRRLQQRQDDFMARLAREARARQAARDENAAADLDDGWEEMPGDDDEGEDVSASGGMSGSGAMPGIAVAADGEDAEEEEGETQLDLEALRLKRMERFAAKGRETSSDGTSTEAGPSTPLTVPAADAEIATPDQAEDSSQVAQGKRRQLDEDLPASPEAESSSSGHAGAAPEQASAASAQESDEAWGLAEGFPDGQQDGAELRADPQAPPHQDGTQQPASPIDGGDQEPAGQVAALPALPEQNGADSDGDEETINGDEPEAEAQNGHQGDAAAQAAPLREADDAAWEDLPDDEDAAPDVPEGAAIEDDIDGMLEAIGLRGPLENLTANVAMMLVLCSFVLLVFVAIPYILGRLLGLGGNVVRVASLPVRLLRLVTDPFFDFVIERVLRIGAALQSLAGGVVGKAAPSAAAIATPLAAQPTAASKVIPPILSHVSPLVARVVPQASYLDEKAAQLVDQLQSSSAAAFEDFLERGEALVNTLRAKTAGRTTSDRVFCVALGWAHWTVAMVAQSYVGEGVYRRLRISWARTAMEQQLTILKVLLFIGIELVIFPLGCGLVVDLCALPLWAGQTPATRYWQIRAAPFSVLFLEWMVGTLFMYAFAQFVGSVRAVARPGVMAWIRDSSDPNFSPVKDILERRASVHLHKIGISALMYASVFIAMVGVNSFVVRQLGLGLLPLRWTPHEALSRTPFDLLAVVLFMRIVIRRVAPHRIYRRWSKRWWAAAARHLRLTAFLVGGAHPEQEGDHVRHTWSAWLRRAQADPHGEYDDAEVTFVPNGSWARVANDDHAVLSAPLIIATDASGTPLTPEGEAAMNKQLEAIAKMTSRKPSYTISYIPPHFRLRLFALVALMWLTLSACAIGALAVPVTIGRAAVWLAGWEPIHDCYTFGFGVGLILIGVNLGGKTYRRVRRSRGALASRTGRSLLARRILAKTVKQLKRAWILFAFGFVTPTLLGLVFETYLLIPLRFTLDEVPRVVLAQTWACGLVEQYIVVRLAHPLIAAGRAPPRTRMHALLVGAIEIRSFGMRRPRALHWTRTVLLPTLAISAALLVGPLLGVRIAVDLCGVPAQHARLLHRLCHGAILSQAILAHAVRRARGRVSSWTAILRDEHFLESTQLANFEPAAPEPDVPEPTVPIPDASLARIRQDAEAGLREAQEALEGLDAQPGPAVETGPVPDVLLGL